MNQLPDEVKNEFCEGNFVVKGSEQRFNQVSPGHSQEWLNAVGKKGGGIVGITKTTSALTRWTLSYNLRSCIASQTRALFRVGHDDQIIHNENTLGRIKRDNYDEKNILSVLLRFKIFSHDVSSDILQNIATKDLVTAEIQEHLINAEKLGQEQLEKFVKERLIVPNEDQRPVKLRDTLHKTKAQTFSSLYVVGKKVLGKEITLKADRNVLQRLITAYQAGRPVDLHKTLQHELMAVPIALAYI